MGTTKKHIMSKADLKRKLNNQLKVWKKKQSEANATVAFLEQSIKQAK